MITPKTLSSILDSFMGRLSLALAEKFDDDIVAGGNLMIFLVYLVVIPLY